MSFVVRNATADDALSIAQVRVDTWRHAYRDIIDAQFLTSMSVEGSAERMRERLADPSGKLFCLVAERDCQVLGFCMCGQNLDEPFSAEWFLFALYVSPTHQGKGLGTALLSGALEEGRARGANRMALAVLKANTPSIEFYVRTGALYVGSGSLDIGGIEYDTDYFEYPL